MIRVWYWSLIAYHDRPPCATSLQSLHYLRAVPDVARNAHIEPKLVYDLPSAVAVIRRLPVQVVDPDCKEFVP